MDAPRKLGIGSALVAVGTLGTLVGPHLGATDLARPWSFVAGFVVGCLLGLGATLSLAGLLEGRPGAG